MHIWPEVGLLEVIQDNLYASVGETGKLIGTGLFNIDMPLIRYDVGDRGSLSNPDMKCECGRLLPLLGNIEGRADDVLYTKDGRHVGRLDPVFKAHLPVIEAQIIQETLDNVTVRFIPASDFQPKDGQSIIERIQARMGNIHVRLEPVSELPREANGKFRAVISHIETPRIEHS
jgi:phenylacetate-CoA ligase